MAIQETLTGSVESAEVYPTAPVSEFTVSGGTGIGTVTLEYLAPNATKWVSIATNINGGAVNTPDPAYLYRFRAINTDGTKVYFGP